MRRTRINPISEKRKLQIEIEKQLKMKLLIENGLKCMTCGQKPSWIPLSLSHIIPKGRMGKTNRENCIIECNDCHSKYEKKPETRPADSLGFQLYVKQITKKMEGNV